MKYLNQGKLHFTSSAVETIQSYFYSYWWRNNYVGNQRPRQYQNYNFPQRNTLINYGDSILVHPPYNLFIITHENLHNETKQQSWRIHSINLCMCLWPVTKILKPALKILKHKWTNYSSSYQISWVTHSVQINWITVSKW